MTAPKENSMLMVDSHAHIWLADMPLMANPRHRLDYDFSIEQYLAVLAEHGVDYAVIAAASPYGDYNDYTIESIRNRPRLRGTVILEPNVERPTLDWMNAAGIVGVRLPYISMSTLPDLTTFENRRTLRRFADLDWHVHLHLDGPRIPQVLPVLEQSGVKVVIDHMGRPDPVLRERCAGFEAVLRSVDKGRTWVKLSGGYRLGEHSVALAHTLCSRLGHERLLWASDCPFVGVETTTYQSTLDWLEQAVPDEAHRHQLGLNAIDLYFRGTRPRSA